MSILIINLEYFFVFRYFSWEVFLYREIEFFIVKFFIKGVVMFFFLIKGKFLFLDILDGNLFFKVKLNFFFLEVFYKKCVYVFSIVFLF